MTNQDTDKKNNIEEQKKEKISTKKAETVESNDKISDESVVNKEGSGEKESKASDKENKETVPKSKLKKKKKLRRQIQRGRAYINSTYNNTVVSLSDLHGNLLAWSSAGLLGFKGAKKATTFAANQVVLDVTEKVEKYGLKDIEVFVKGVGSGREAAVRALAQKGFNLMMIKDKTPIPHNGCRPKKPRRV
jgi:small subunit ribosomal protein S11